MRCGDSEARTTGPARLDYATRVRLGCIRAQALAFAVMAIATAAVTIDAPHVTALRVVSGIALLLAPGYVLTAALFPPGSLSGGERLAFVGGIELAVLVFLGLALDVVPGGLDRTSWSIGLACVTIAGSAANGLSKRGDGSPDRRWRAPVVPIVAGLAAIAVALAALALTRESALRHDRKTRFTELWELPANPRGSAVSYGVTNDEGNIETYRLVARSDGRVIFRSRAFRLVAGASRTGRFDVDRRGVNTVRIDLYRTADPTALPYRSTRLVLNGPHAG
jgi:Protein of unknown function (DUF1616)